MFKKSKLPIVIEYQSSRFDTWNMYCHLWRRKLWQVHLSWLLIFVGVGCGVIAYRQNLTPKLAAELTMIGCVLLLVFPCYPQLVFRGGRRVLRVDSSGLLITLGPRQKSIPWSSVAGSHENDRYVSVVMTNGNALLVPKRAFESDQQRNQFRDDLLEMIPK